MNQAAITYIQLSVVIAPGPPVLNGTFRLPITVDGHLNVLVVGHGGGTVDGQKKQGLSGKEERKCGLNRTAGKRPEGSLRHGVIKDMAVAWHGIAWTALDALDGRPR